MRPSEELYDLKTDRDCVLNLAASSEQTARMTLMHDQMTAELKEQHDPRMFGQGHVFDEYPVANQSNRNFYERWQRGEKLKAGWVSDTDFEPEPLK